MAIKLLGRYRKYTQKNPYGQDMNLVERPVAQGPRFIPSHAFAQAPASHPMLSTARLLTTLGLIATVVKPKSSIGLFSTTPSMSLRHRRPQNSTSFISTQGQDFKIDSKRFATMVPKQNPVLKLELNVELKHDHQPELLPGPGFVAPSPF